ncbi:hypothetical protein MRX96_041738 [Rhipicephalus microplus]
MEKAQLCDALGLHESRNSTDHDDTNGSYDSSRRKVLGVMQVCLESAISRSSCAADNTTCLANRQRSVLPSGSHSAAGSSEKKRAVARKAIAPSLPRGSHEGCWCSGLSGVTGPRQQSSTAPVGRGELARCGRSPSPHTTA